MKDQCIVAIDPGGTTGVCVIQELANDFQVVYIDQIPWQNRVTFFKALFAGTLTDVNGKPLLPEVVVIEAFRLRPGRAMEQVGSVFPSVRIIGIVEALISFMTPPPLLVFQEPIDMSRVSILPEHEELLKGFIHVQAAYKHARYYHVITGG